MYTFGMDTEMHTFDYLKVELQYQIWRQVYLLGDGTWKYLQETIVCC